MKKAYNRGMKIVLTVFILVICVYLFLICPGLRKRNDLKKMRRVLFAHRGLYDNAGDHPENSMAAFRLAVEGGYGIEMDVQLTKDDVPVVFHDFTLKRVARNVHDVPVEGKVAEYTFEQLQQFHLLNSEEKIPKFEDFLTLVDGKVPVIIEYKIENSDTECRVCEIVDHMLRAYKGPYVIESFNPRGLLWYKKHHKEITRGQLSDCYRKSDPEHMRGLFYFIFENVMVNFLTKPDFIAYNHKYYKNVSRRLCRQLFGNTAVAYTIKSQEQLEQRKKDFDIFIFDSFVPKDGSDATKL